MEGDTGYSAKVPIARLKRHEKQNPPPSKPPRVRSETVNKACTSCRKRKTKCSGTRPRCSNCEKLNDSCVYEQPRRDRLRDALHKGELLTALLKDIRLVLDGENVKRVDDALQQFENDTPPSTPSVVTRASTGSRPRSSSNNVERDSQPPDEHQVSASVGSTEDLDFLDENLLQDQGPSETGYLGRNSQVQWMRALERKLEQPDGGPPDESYAPPGDSEEAVERRAEAFHRRRKHSGNTGRLVDYYFYLDNNQINHIENVDPDAVPSPEIAKNLFGFYQAAVHTPFRILDAEFETQLRTFYQMDQRSSTLNVSIKWKAVLNLVFAIGARYSYLVGADWRADDHDHFIYMSRAVHFLGLNKITTLVCAPEKHLIQATALFSFYYLIVGHVSRAWYMIGISLRHAQAAGMHLRNEDLSLSLDRKRAMAQTWWALHSIECILTSITGRPRVIHLKDCTVPLLTSLTEGNTTTKKPSQDWSRPLPRHTTLDSSSASSHIPTHSEHTNTSMDEDIFLSAWTDLDVIQHKSLTKLYSAGTAMHPWKHTQDEISSLTTELDKWALQTLPHGAFGTVSATEPNMRREHMLLFFYYQSVKICITRPCLCRLDRRIKGQSQESTEFNRSTAEACVQAALDLTSSMPEPADSRWIYGKGPWWSTVHIMMQAITVLLLEMAQSASQLSKEPSKIIACVEKLVQWLEAMKQIDGVAERAYNTVCKTLRKHESFARKMFPTQWDTMQSTEQDATTSTGKEPQGHQMANPEVSSESMWPLMPVDEDFYAAANQGHFDLNTLTDPLPDPLPDPYINFQFGQTQYPLFYGNQFTTVYDQDMTYEYGESANMEGWTGMGEEQ